MAPTLHTRTLHHSDESTPAERVVETSLGELTRAEKVTLLTGRDMWSTMAIERIGLRSMVLADGPAGVRGTRRDERLPSLSLPCGTALAASWDPDLAQQYGSALAGEARRKGVDVVLGPTLNLARSPLGGRNFEAFGEDPHLTGHLGAGYVRGLQSGGVASSAKHYVGNDFETDRTTVDVVIQDRALHEVYLRPFEHVVLQAQPWTVMSAYNGVNGRPMTENELLTTPLKTSWQFDGVVVSDWTAVTSLESARAGQDLVMPGPVGPWGAALVTAIEQGRVDEGMVDDKVRRILRLAYRVGALDAEAESPTPFDGPSFARRCGVAGTVLLKNDGILPLEGGDRLRIAVIGQFARDTEAQGGGSASVVPERGLSPLDGIRKAFPRAEVSFHLGSMVRTGLEPFPLDSIVNPRTGEPGLLVRFLDSSGEEIWAEDRRAARLVWFSGESQYLGGRRIEVSAVHTPELSGEIMLGYAANGHSSLFVDDLLVRDVAMWSEQTNLGAAISSPAQTSVQVRMTEGRPTRIRLVADIEDVIPGSTALSLTLGVVSGVPDQERLIQEASAAAEQADVAIVVVGTGPAVESEGYDRDSLILPGYQDELVTAIAEVNPRTVVVVAAGSPVQMSWSDKVAAVLVTWFAGQECGQILGDVLAGQEPGGRLPMTWPTALADAPVVGVTPDDLEMRYDDGIHIGYRGWLRSGIAPAFEFGFGLSYTNWDLGEPTVSMSHEHPDAVSLTICLRNTGGRRGRQVVQVYASKADSTIDRPVRWLVAFKAATVSPGEAVNLTMLIPTRELCHWDGSDWALEPGGYSLHIGTSVGNTPKTVSIGITAATTTDSRRRGDPAAGAVADSVTTTQRD